MPLFPNIDNDHDFRIIKKYCTSNQPKKTIYIELQKSMARLHIFNYTITRHFFANIFYSFEKTVYNFHYS